MQICFLHVENKFFDKFKINYYLKTIQEHSECSWIVFKFTISLKHIPRALENET